MNRRHFLTAALAAPAAVALPSVVGAAEFDFGHATHKPPTEEERTAIDGMSEEDLTNTFRRTFSDRRLASMTGRCNAAYTMGACFGVHEPFVDVTYIRSLIPRLNAGLRADFDALMSPLMLYGLSRIVDESSISPLTVNDFVHGELDGWGGEKLMLHHFVHAIPGRAESGIYIPRIADI